MTINPTKALLLTATIAIAALYAEHALFAAEPFFLSSTTFKDGAMLPKKVGDIPARGPNCKGDNVSPEFAWSNPPEGTKSYAFIVFDVDGANGAGFVHWVGYGVAPDVASFAEGEINRPSDKYVGGTSGKGLAFFAGPCPPAGSPHHYLFQIVATDLDPKALPPGLKLPELEERLKGHRKGESSLVGTFVNPYPN